MTTTQKVIKKVAIAIAICLAVSIISTCFIGLYYLGGVLGFDTKEESKDLKEIKLPNASNKNIKIELKASNLTIKKGPSFKLESTSSKVKAKEHERYLVIEEQSNWLLPDNKKQVILTIPDTKLESLEVETGAGLFKLENLKVDKLDLDLGLGKATLDNLEVYKKTDIDSGVGDVIINKSKMNNLELNMGAGSIVVNATIHGKSKIEAGVGSLDLNILESKELYTLILEKGIGSIKIDNKNEKNKISGIGVNILDIEGGIGDININFKENKEEL